MPRTFFVVLAVMLVPAVLMGVAWGWRSAAVYLFFLAVAVLVFLASRVGAEWLQESSRGRFRR